MRVDDDAQSLQSTGIARCTPTGTVETIREYPMTSLGQETAPMACRLGNRLLPAPLSGAPRRNQTSGPLAAPGPALAAALFAGGPALAQTVEVPTHQAMSGVELTLSVSELGSGRVLQRSTTRSASDGPVGLQLGTAVVVCFTASREGWITLWSVDEFDRPTRIFPNRLSHDGGDTMAGAPVAANERTCLGDDARFSFTVGGQAGATYQLSLNWTPQADDALPADAYVQIGPRARSVSEGDARFAATHIVYSPTD